MEPTNNYVCTACNWVYMPKRGDSEGCIPPNTPFEDLPVDWLCPMCGVGKEIFIKEE